MNALFRLTLMLTFIIPCIAQSTDCYDSLQVVVRYESLFGKVVEVSDISHMAKETKMYSDPSLRIVDVTKIAEGSKALLGFGKPNVYLIVPQKNGSSERELYRVAAKSLKKGNTSYSKINYKVQSGLMVVFDDLNEQELNTLHESAIKYEGTRGWTCVNTNCRILQDSGFTIGSEPPSHFYFPRTLLKAIVDNGLELNGRKINFTLYRTAPQYLEDLNQSIAKAVRTTLCRHGDKACKAAVKSDSNLKVYLAKIGQKLVAFLQPNARSLETTILDGSIVQVKPLDKEPELTISVSQPSRLGYLMRLIWGPHAFHEIDISHLQNELQPIINEGYLKAFPNGAPTVVDRLKQSLLFPKPVINAIRAHMAASYAIFGNVGISNLFNTMRSHTDKQNHKYNIVVTRTKIVIVKVSMRSSIPDWVLAKHVLASGYSDEVIFAGEIWKTTEGEIQMNNESGSYHPTPERLATIVNIFSKLLPRFSIVGRPLGE